MAEKEVKGIKKFFEEFKAFAMRGNVLDMAVGVVIGGAFTAIVNSLVNDIINPAIGLFFNADFSDVGIHVGDVMIGIGSFINAIINFLIVAFVLFVVIKTINALHKKPAEPEAPAEPTTPAVPTGDAGDTGLWMGLVALCGMSLAALLRTGKRKEQ